MRTKCFQRERWKLRKGKMTEKGEKEKREIEIQK